MCGIAGIIQLDNPQTLHEVARMTRALAHRGPDGEGLWTNPSAVLAFGHRRLAVLDPSANAAQPMHFGNRYTIIHNGEIYNYKELAEELRKKGYTFRTQSDTEVLLAAYACYGTLCVDYLDGMFAFAIWDEEEQQLFAARDRFGEKPFYYHFEPVGRKFSFASEPKAFRAAGFPMTINQGLLLAFLTTNTCSHPQDSSQTFYAGLLQLPAAHYLTYCPRRDRQGPTVARYWEPEPGSPVFPSPDAAIAQFKEWFQESVRKRLRSDVPVGTSLSGGIDSSAIVANIHEQPNITPHYRHVGVTAVFPGYEKDEAARAQDTARHFGLTHFTTAPDATQFAHEIERLIHHHEEPISSASVYAQYKVFELAAASGLTVLLDGQGADELLAGYSRYQHWFLQELLRRGKLRQFSNERRGLQANDPQFRWDWKTIGAAAWPSFARTILEKKTARRILHHPDINPDFAQAHFSPSLSYKPVIQSLNDILRWTSCHHGLDELLRYADRNAMAHGREVRLPFLQHQWASWMLQLPASYKIRNGYSKWILRSSLEGILPATTVWQKNKIGFEPPQKAWMTHPIVQEKIRAAKEKGVKEKYLHPNVLKQAIAPHHAYDQQASDWCQFVAGTLLTL